ncbi:MAG: tRNA uracil 4-sulfurtransferase ThiI [Methanoculleaceae archaeon]
MEEVVLVRFGELFLKSEPVRRRFMEILGRNCAGALDAADIADRVELHRDRILVHTPDPDAAVRRIAGVFGVVDASVCTITEPTIGACTEAALIRARMRLKPGMTFAVRARRSRIRGFTSMELASAVGSEILNQIPGVSVDLTSPDYEIFVEARPFGGLVYDTRIPGPGGLPLGTQPPVLLLLSSGFDSPVSGWLMMRRGCPLVNLTFDAGRFQGRDVRAAVIRNHCVLSEYTSNQPLDLLVAGAEPFFSELVKRVTPGFRCIVCKRFMARAASSIARGRGLTAVVTGENLGQVASQTLTNLALIDEAASLLVLRPVIARDKKEILDLAARIGIGVQDGADLGCRAVPGHPATSARREDIRKEEERLDLEGLIDEICGSIRCIRARNGEVIQE